MKENVLVRLTGLLLGTNHGCITTNPNQSVLQCNAMQCNAMQTSQFIFNQKARSLRLRHQLGSFRLTVFWNFQGMLLAYFQKRGGNVNSASYCEVLLNLRDAIRRKRPGQLSRGALLRHDNARSHTARANSGGNTRTIVGTSWTSALQPLLGLVWFISVWSAKIPPWCQTFRWWRRGWNGGAEGAETTVKILPCCGFLRTGKATGQMYECWWRIYREIIFFFQFRISNILRFTYVNLWHIYLLRRINEYQESSWG
jgi:hypothetical protein